MTETEDDPNEVWQYDRALSPAGYLRAIKALGMSRIEAARYLGVSERTARRFATGDGDIPPPVVLLLRALLHYNARPVVPQIHIYENRDGRSGIDPQPGRQPAAAAYRTPDELVRQPAPVG